MGNQRTSYRMTNMTIHPCSALALALVLTASAGQLSLGQEQNLAKRQYIENRLRTQPAHRVLQPTAPPSELGSAPHHITQPMPSTAGQAAFDSATGRPIVVPELAEVPEYEAPWILEEDSAAAIAARTPHASGPPRVTTEPKPGHPFAATHEHLHGYVLHGDKADARPEIPGAVRQPVWKTPYSYGYFGAGRKRQWTLHYGHQQTYTQWTLR